MLMLLMMGNDYDDDYDRSEGGFLVWYRAVGNGDYAAADADDADG